MASDVSRQAWGGSPVGIRWGMREVVGVSISMSAIGRYRLLIRVVGFPLCAHAPCSLKVGTTTHTRGTKSKLRLTRRVSRPRRVPTRARGQLDPSDGLANGDYVGIRARNWKLDVDAICSQPSPGSCTKAECKQSVSELIAYPQTVVVPLFDLSGNHCERWVEAMRSQSRPRNDKCFKAMNQWFTTDHLMPPPGWFTTRRLRQRHCVMKITLCSGHVFFLDNGSLGGRDNVIAPGEIPGSWEFGGYYP